MTTSEIITIVLLTIIAIAMVYCALLLKQIIVYNQVVIGEDIRKMYAGLDERLQEIHKRTTAIEQAVKDLLAFETRNEKANKWQLKELQQRVHTYDVETKSVFDKNEVEQDNSNKV